MGKKFASLIILLLILQIIPCYSQEPFYTDTYIKKVMPTDLIDNPTANILNRQQFRLNLRVYHLGGMLGGLSARITSKLMFGVSYGGQNIIGQGSVKWNEAPGVHIRYRMAFETDQIPAICIGFNSQGYGTYYPPLNRYQIKSKGFYVALSKNIGILRGFGLHGGINYSDENKGDEKDINFFCGANLNIDRELSVVWEYDFGINDNDNQSLGSGKGYMNAALRWYFSEQLVFELSIKNLLKNNRTLDGEQIPNANRELKIIYFQNI